MKLIRYIRGQISLSILLSALGLFSAAGGVVIAKFYRVDDRVNTTIEKVSVVESRTAVLEEAIKMLREDNREIKSDLKDILKKLK